MKIEHCGVKTVRGKTLALLVAFAPTSAFALQPPSDLDLRAMYCVVSRQNALAFFERFLATIDPNSPHEWDRVAHRKLAASASLARTDVERLLAYISPKFGHVIPDPLLAAAGRAKADIAAAETSQSQCSVDCRAKLGVTGKETPAQVGPLATCLELCYGDVDASKRLKSCWPVNWLPF